jgi:uncharacterized protein (DUF58 family)
VNNEFRYEIGWRASRYRPGHHRSVHAGSGLEFAHHAPLLNSPDPRRLDLHATLRNPFGEPIVRVYRQRSAINVQVLADFSASMAYVGVQNKFEVLTQFSVAAAYSATRSGDAFGFSAANDAVIEALQLSPMHARGADQLLAERLSRVKPSGRSAAGLLEAARLLGRERALVFLVSDFHFPMALLEQLLSALESHYVVPVIIWDRAEYTIPRRWGIGAMTDIETGAQRMMIVRPSSRQRLLEIFQQRARALRDLFARYSLRPLELLDGFDADRVSQYFVDPHAVQDLS